MIKIYINHIGFFAHEVLQRSEGAQVSGIASRGIYLQPKDDWTLYLSLEKYCGPLTLNFREGSAKLDKIDAGSPVQLNPGELYFPDEKITIPLQDSTVWYPPPVDPEIKSLAGDLDSILSIVYKIIPENPYLPLLSSKPGKIPGVAVIGERILAFQKILGSGDSEKLAESAIRLLGLGPGLTPLGDDFLLGVLLALNRWGHVLPTDLRKNSNNEKGSSSPIQVSDLNQIILENTPLKTTRISASLLACAAEGTADERLLVVSDGLFAGSEVTQNEMRNMLRWGNSSGITVLAGMISVLRAQDTAS